MLRIKELDSGDLVTFVLSGRIQKEDLAELKSLVEKHHKSVVLDLEGVKLVDRDTVGFWRDLKPTRQRSPIVPAISVNGCSENGPNRRNKGRALFRQG